jgi:hypothetical protein
MLLGFTEIEAVGAGGGGGGGGAGATFFLQAPSIMIGQIIAVTTRHFMRSLVTFHLPATRVRSEPIPKQVSSRQKWKLIASGTGTASCGPIVVGDREFALMPRYQTLSEYGELRSQGFHTLIVSTRSQSDDAEGEQALEYAAICAK